MRLKGSGRVHGTARGNEGSSTMTQFETAPQAKGHGRGERAGGEPPS